MKLMIGLVVMLVACKNTSALEERVAKLEARVEALEGPKPDPAQEKRALDQARAQVERDLADLDRRVSAAVEAVVAAQTDADRMAANAQLASLRKQKAEMEQRISEAKARAMR